MTEIERKALALVNETALYDEPWTLDDVLGGVVFKALCRAIEQHEAFRQEVSAACEKWTKENVNCREAHDLDRFILPKPDPIAEVLSLASSPVPRDTFVERLAARGLKIVEDK